VRRGWAAVGSDESYHYFVEGLSLCKQTTLDDRRRNLSMTLMSVRYACKTCRREAERQHVAHVAAVIEHLDALDKERSRGPWVQKRAMFGTSREIVGDCATLQSNNGKAHTNARINVALENALPVLLNYIHHLDTRTEDTP
jgi:hypothetical protein